MLSHHRYHQHDLHILIRIYIRMTNVQTGGIVKTSGCTRGNSKNRWFYYTYLFSSGIPGEQAHLRKSNPQKIARKVDFCEPHLS